MIYLCIAAFFLGLGVGFCAYHFLYRQGRKGLWFCYWALISIGVLYCLSKLWWS